MESKQVSIEGLKDPVKVWEIVTGGMADEFWKPSAEGDQVEGKLVGSMDGSFGKTWLLEVGGRVVGLPSHTTLQNTLLKVPLSSFVRVTYEGEKQNERKQNYRLYKVEIQREAEKFF